MARNWEIPEGYIPTFYQEGNFTVCFLSNGGTTEWAFSKRNPKLDPYDSDLGREIALRRAIKKLNGWASSTDKLPF